MSSFTKGQRCISVQSNSRNYSPYSTDPIANRRDSQQPKLAILAKPISFPLDTAASIQTWPSRRQ